MNVDIFKMDPEVAERKLLAYRTQLKRRANVEYELAVKGYEAAAKGLPLLNMVEVLQKLGLREDGLPPIAIARADRQEVQVHVHVSSGEQAIAFDALRQRITSAYQGDLYLRFPLTLPIANYKTGFAMVPMVPADVYPNKGQLSSYFVLWEVEQWAKRSSTQPPRDPYLLTHIAGELYAVIAEWDLTELERAIMAGRKRRARS